jgi:dTDP-3-amino-3,4,6-trideoxy-alpha-D-glucose transaminase
LGDGGAVVTDDEQVAALARRLRFHGSDDKQTFVEVGYNSRLDEMQAAALRVLLPELDGWNAARRAAAGAYERHGLAEHVTPPVPVEGAEHVYHLYVGRHERADELVAQLNDRGVGARAYYRVPVHRQPSMARFSAEGPDLPGTEEAARTGVALPMGTGLSDEAVGEVVAACASGST